jgi:hypothetical protein
LDVIRAASTRCTATLDRNLHSLAGCLADLAMRFSGEARPTPDCSHVPVRRVTRWQQSGGAMPTESAARILRLKALLERTGLSRSTLSRKTQERRFVIQGHENFGGYSVFGNTRPINK